VASLRRGGSVSLFFVEGEIPDPQAPAFVAALQAQRFRSIETAAAEETSTGWVCTVDPSGDSFPFEELDLDHAVWLQMRTDKKKLPARWVAIYRAAAERAAGRKLDGKERRALKEDLLEKLLPRVLPAVQILDVLLDRRARRVLLLATGKSARDEFASLFRRTFAGARLEPATALAWAVRCKITPEERRRLEEVAPVKWPSQRQPAPSRTAPAAQSPSVLEVEA